MATEGYASASEYVRTLMREAQKLSGPVYKNLVLVLNNGVPSQANLYLPANFAWGDEDGRTLYMTARTSLYRIRLKVPGIRP